MLLPPNVVEPVPAVISSVLPGRVLVVDDVQANLVAMHGLLADTGLDVLTASCAQQALELLLQHDVALALLDVQMPGIDGFALAELMRGSERTRHVPIIFLTAGAQETSGPMGSFRGYAAGAVDVLYKPFDERVLRSKIAVFVELHRQRRALAEHAAQLQRLAQVNAAMLASLSHDLLDPLAALALTAEILHKRAESPALRQAAARQKAATVLLQRQVHHLINLAKEPDAELRPRVSATELGRLARERWHAHCEQLGTEAAGEFSAVGDTVGWWDAGLVAAAVDQLMLQAQTHCGGSAIRLHVDGNARGSVTLRLEFPTVLTEAAAVHLFGAGAPMHGVPPQAGVGLYEADRVARAHGGSLIGITRAGAGTCLELVLPRGARVG